MSDLKPWPEKPDYADRIRGIAVAGMSFPENQKLLVLMYYERSLAEAALDRLHVALDALQTIRDGSPLAAETAQRALDRIGSLPGE